MDVEVIVVGAGPTGLMLATELSSAGVSTVVLDRLPVGTKAPRAGGVQPRTNEVFAMRGLLDPLRASKPNREHQQTHFAGLRLDYSVLRPSGPMLHLEQQHIEAFLEDLLCDRGVPVLRGHEVVAVSQDANGVTARANNARGSVRVSGRHLVAADGGHSTVRKLLGVDFPGRAAVGTAIIADIKFRGTSNPILLNPSAQLGRPMWAADGSWAMCFDLHDGWTRLVTSVTGAPSREVPVTDGEIEAALRRVFEPEVELLDTRDVARISDAARQVERYRVGRVYFAGDAAHIHLPFGGQGLNLGVQNAVNPGWKLIAAVRGWAPDGVLDSYHDERHPVAATVLRNARAQGLLITVPVDTNPTESHAGRKT